ncbi:MAG: DUF4055 domain-containing protein [Sphaerospermopsis sp. SIO1G2]|nr:DUF4055 domain-containing protein [Sphaerospermopsis sp. SIO1G2]
MIRALFPELHEEFVKSAVGRMTHKEAIIRLPEVMEPLRKSATIHGESLQELLIRIYREQCITGRLGLLADVPNGSDIGTLPYIALYGCEKIINWDDGEVSMPTKQTLNMVVIDESEYTRNEFDWEYTDKFRVLVLGDFEDAETSAPYRTALLIDETEYSEDKLITPRINGRVSTKIPFTFINTSDTLPEPEKAVALPLSNLSLHIYRKEADYNQALYLQGQDTLVIIGGRSDPEADVRVGAGARIDLDGGDHSNAKFIGVDSQGLPEMRQSLEADYGNANQLAGRVLTNSPTERESGNSLRVRIGAQVANLKTIARTGANGLEQQLRIMAEWLGADPDEVQVVPNMDFADDLMTADEYLKFVDAVGKGGLSLDSLLELAKQRGVVNTTVAEEKQRIQETVLSVQEENTVGQEQDVPEQDPVEEPEEE